ELPMDAEHRRYWAGSQMAALQMVNAVKGAKHLQKNLQPRLAGPDTPVRAAYLELRAHLFGQLRALHRLGRSGDHDAAADTLARLDAANEGFHARFRQQLFAQVRDGVYDGLAAGSLLNDQNYAEQIYRHLRQLVDLADEPGSPRQPRQLSAG